jgi:hypothetical protein
MKKKHDYTKRRCNIKIKVASQFPDSLYRNTDTDSYVTNIKWLHFMERNTSYKIDSPSNTERFPAFNVTRGSFSYTQGPNAVTYSKPAELWIPGYNAM